MTNISQSIQVFECQKLHCILTVEVDKLRNIHTFIHGANLEARREFTSEELMYSRLIHYFVDGEISELGDLRVFKSVFDWLQSIHEYEKRFDSQSE